MSSRDEGLKGISSIGHRAYVGGDGPFWDLIGQKQLDYLVQAGLQPGHVLLDFACGSLRAGRLLIDYLDEGNYLGLDKEIGLIILGVAEELGTEKYLRRRPEFVVSDRFEFDRFSKQPDYIIAQSLYTHLTLVDIAQSLKSLRAWISGDVRFFATFFETETAHANPATSHSHAHFRHSQADLAAVADRTGWVMTYHGDWNHPRNQMMVEFRPAR